MKNKNVLIRVIRETVNISSGQCEVIYLQFLVNYYQDNDFYKDVAFTVSFQRNVNEQPSRWYGLNFEIRTDKVPHIEYMAKIARILKNADCSTPMQLFEILSAKQAICIDGDFIECSSFPYYKVTFKETDKDSIYAIRYVHNYGEIDKVQKQLYYHRELEYSYDYTDIFVEPVSILP